jgi:hypothetical protein
MRTEIAALWTAALRSGTYDQTKEVLNDGQGMCCLGVLCDLHAQAHPEIHGWKDYEYMSEDAELPFEVAQWAGIDPLKLGGLPESVYADDDLHSTHLAMLNDNGATFKEIADVIDKYEDAL